MSDLQEMMRVFQSVTEKKKLDPVGKEDGDIDNDGDTDSSDAYLKNRRKKIGQAMGKEKKEGYGKKMKESKVECPKCEGKGCSHCDDKGYHMKETTMEETLASIETNRRVMKWTDFKEAVAGYDEVTYKDKKRPQDMEIGQSSVRSPDAKRETKGATPPEGIMDKESPKSKQFYKDHQKSDKKWEDMEDIAHDDASKAMKAGPGPKYRSGDNKSGDKNIINKPSGKF